MEWIKCSDKLPERCQKVLVYVEKDAWNENGRFRKRDICIGWQVEGYWYCDGCSEVTGLAWMPLPDLPNIS